MTEQLSVNLASDISYVSGTVNGEEAIFSLTSPGIWTAIVPKSTNGKYELNIIAYNNAGSTVGYDAVIYKLDTITELLADWTSEDYYNYEDINKVEANIEYISDYIRSLQYEIPQLEIRVDRSMSSVDFISSINRIENNLEVIKNNFISPIGYESKVNWKVGKGFTYNDANRWERNIKRLYELALIVKDNFIYCGTFNCGSQWEGGVY